MYVSKKTYTISRAVLATLGVAGVLSVAVLAPNAVQAFKVFDIFPKKKRYQKNAAYLTYDVTNTIIRLCREKCLKVEYQESGTYAYLTEKGKKLLLQYETDGHVHDRKAWDGKWRIVVFDICEERKTIREKFRRSLISYGFKRMQNSVWIFPYDCEDFISIVKTDKKLWGNVLYVVADRVEGADNFKKIFHVS